MHQSSAVQPLKAAGTESKVVIHHFGSNPKAAHINLQEESISVSMKVIEMHSEVGRV